MKVLIRKSGSDEKWKVLPYEEYKEEIDLRNIILKDPKVIPIGEISSDMDALIEVVLKEVYVPNVGYIDLLGIDKQGNLYIIETKLSRNPESRRQVIGANS